MSIEIIVFHREIELEIKIALSKKSPRGQRRRKHTPLGRSSYSPYLVDKMRNMCPLCGLRKATLPVDARDPLRCRGHF